MYYFIKISNLLLLFLVPSLVIGPFLSDLIVTSLSIYFLIFCFKNNYLYYFKNNYFYFFLVFYFYLIFNSLFQNQNIDSLRISISYIRFGVFCIMVKFILDHNKFFLKNFFYSIILIFCILVFDGFIQFFFNKNILGYPITITQTGTRVSSFFNDELILGSFLSRIMPIFFGLWFFLKKDLNKYYNILIPLIFILSEVLIFLSGERTSFFYLNLSAFFMIFFLKNYKLFRLSILIISFSIIFLISVFQPKAKERIVDFTKEQIFTKDKTYIFSEVYESHYITAYKMFIANPFFGVGVKNFRNFCSEKSFKVSNYSCSTHPHNTYLQILSELGMFGFAFIFVIIILFATNIFHHIKKIHKTNKYFFNDFEICLISACLVTLWPFSPSGNFFNNWLNIIYYLPVGFLIWSLGKKN